MLTEALAAETLPEGYVLSDATVDLGALAIADVAAAQAAAAAVVAGAANAAELELAATYTIADTLANVQAADAAVLAAADSYSLTDAAGALGELTEAQAAVVLGAANVVDFTYTVEFTLTEALEALAAANNAKGDFLEEQELADDDAVADAVKDADEFVAAYTYSEVSAIGEETATDVAVYEVDDSVGVKAAKLADAQAQLNTNLANLTKLLDEAKAEVAEVTGLNSAINAFDSRVATLESAEKAELDAKAVEAGALASLNTLNDGSNLEISGADTLDGFIVVVNEKLKVADTVSAALKPAATTLLNAINARISAEATTAAADTAVDNALLTVGYLDFAVDAKNEIGALFRADLTPAQTNALTRTQVQNELNAQKAIANTLADKDASGVTFVDQTGTFEIAMGANEAAASAALSFNFLKGEVDAFHAAIVDVADGDFTLAKTPLLSAQLVAQDKVDAAVEVIDGLAELVSNLADAKAVDAELADLNAAIAAAEKAFEDEDFEVPVTLDGLAIASAESDIYLAGSNDSEIVNFSAEGNDLLFIGTSFSFVVLGATESINQRVGDAAALEVFAKQVGADVELSVEGQTFAGNALNSIEDITTIILTGVTVADLAFADGAFTIA